MRRKNQIKPGIIIFMTLFIAGILNAQEDEIRKEVTVVKPYQPVLSDANKINLLPGITDTTRLHPDFSYSISPRRINSEFTVRPINAAKMLTEPLPKLYKSYLKAGGGNYLTPYLEISTSKLRDRKSSSGLHVRHKSSSGKVRLENDDRVFGGYANNDIKLYMKKINRNSDFHADIDFMHNSIYHYGYRPVLDTTLEKPDIKKTYLFVNPSFQLASSTLDSNRLHYNLKAGYGFLYDIDNYHEHHGNFEGSLRKLIDLNYLGLDFGIDYFQPSEIIDSSYNAIVKVGPSFSRSSNEWMFLLGFDSYFDVTGESTKPYIYPRAQLSFNVVKNRVIPYFEIKGKLENNNYSSILFENPYIRQDLKVKNASHKIAGIAGFRGRFSSLINFNVNVKYDIINDQHFFINDTSSLLMNKFDVIYDDIRTTRIGGEINYRFSEKLSFFAGGELNNYNTASEEHPWHLPSWKGYFRTHYNLKDKILATFDLSGIGKRYAIDGNADVVVLKAVPDISLHLEYRYTKILSVFLDLNNITASRYYFWHQYPAQRFNFLAGFTYSL
ncbi:MAG: hypothetical protein ACOCYF_01410 [Bacteroidota bacterium]